MSLLSLATRLTATAASSAAAPRAHLVRRLSQLRPPAPLCRLPQTPLLRGALCALPAVKTLIMAELDSTGKAANLKGFEKAKEATIEAQPFDAERGLLTPTFKPKRPQLRKHYQEQLDAMYKALGI